MVIGDRAWASRLVLVGIAFAIGCSHPDIHETSCSDGFDNDGDGLVDAFDPDCSMGFGDAGSGGCTLTPGTACTSSNDCCGDQALTTQGVCANVFGAGNVCHALCSDGSGCSSGCCYQLTDGRGACSGAAQAPSGVACMSSTCCASGLTCSGGTCR